MHWPPTLLARPEARRSDEAPIAHHLPAANEDATYGTGDLHPLVQRVVARMVQVRLADRPSGRWVEQDDVGVATSLDGALAPQAEQARRRGGQQVDHPLEADPPAGDTLGVDQGQERLDARRAVGDPVALLT